MAQRRGVFQSKVLLKLYPAAPKHDESSAIPIEQSLSKKTKRTTQASTGNTNTPAKRIYTALPPPPDYRTDEEKSDTHSQLENINRVENPPEKSGHESSDGTDQAKEPEEKKRKRKKRKDHVAGLSQTAVNAGEERISKNKRRKLKKKRHKEKLLSMGLMPRAAAVEFTYQKEEAQQEDEEDERKAAQ